MKIRDTHEARAAQKSQAHKAGHEDPKPGSAKRSERRLQGVPCFDPKSHKDWMFPRLKVAAVLFAAFFFGCAEEAPMPTMDERLQGAWERKWLNLTTRYNFHDGACDAYAIIPARPVQYYAYAYTTEGDTLAMLDLASGDVQRAVVCFDGDSAAVLVWTGGVDYCLKRL